MGDADGQTHLLGRLSTGLHGAPEEKASRGPEQLDWKNFRPAGEDHQPEQEVLEIGDRRGVYLRNKAPVQMVVVLSSLTKPDSLFFLSTYFERRNFPDDSR